MAFQRQNWKSDVDLPSLTEVKDDLPITPNNVAHNPPENGKPLKEMIKEYFLNCSIHGMQYLAEHNRHWAERLWWIFSIIFSMCYCSSLIMGLYVKWEQNPVIVTFDEKSTNVWAIPFPAVTICLETKANVTQFNFTAMLNMIKNNNTSNEDILRMQAIGHICLPDLLEYFSKFDENGIDGGLLFKTLEKIAPTAESTMWECRFGMNKTHDCSLFHKTWTDEGLCHTYNILDSDDIYTDQMAIDYPKIEHNKTSKYWSLENGYTKSKHMETVYPYRVMGARAYGGLYADLHIYEQDLEHICRGPVRGVKVLLHLPCELPQVSRQYLRVPLNTEATVMIKPNMITTSEGLRDYEPKRRQCYYNTERHLKFFKAYTQRNCELECLSNFTYHKCGCVKFSMPRDNSTPVCGSLRMKCYLETEYDLITRDFEERMAEGIACTRSCNCLPSCTSIIYDTEISLAKIDYNSMRKTLKQLYEEPYEIPGMQPARLQIFFKDNQFITSKRSELYGRTDFLANCGGLLGLFMGISLLSIIEMVYYCTLRLFCNLKSQNERNRLNAEIVGLTEITVENPSINIKYKEQKLN